MPHEGIYYLFSEVVQFSAYPLSERLNRQTMFLRLRLRLAQPSRDLCRLREVKGSSIDVRQTYVEKDAHS